MSARLRAILSVGLLLGFGTIRSAAYWVDDETVTGSGFDSGAIHLDLFDAFRVPGDTHQWAQFTMANMIPGTSVARVVPVTNNSLGRLALTYAVQGSATGTMGQRLQVTLSAGGTSNGTTCTSGTLVGAANTPLTNAATTIGESTVVLSPGQTSQLCVQVRLSPDAPSSTQGQTSTVTFVVVATQVDQ